MNGAAPARHLYYVVCLSAFFTCNTFAQVGINTTDIDFSAILQVESTNKGVLFPRLTLAQREALDAAAPGSGVPAGLTLYCSDCCSNGTGSLFYHNGQAWKSLDSDCTGVGTYPACVSGIASMLQEKDNHLGTDQIPFLFDNRLTNTTQDNTVNLDDLRLHHDGDSVIEFALGEVLAPGAKIVLYWSDIDWSGNLGLVVDLDNGASPSQSSIDTYSNVLPNSTNSANGNDNYILTITLIADTDTITVSSYDDNDGKDPMLLEFKILDDQNNEISFTCN